MHLSFYYLWFFNLKPATFPIFHVCPLNPLPWKTHGVNHRFTHILFLLFLITESLLFSDSLFSYPTLSTELQLILYPMNFLFEVVLVCFWLHRTTSRLLMLLYHWKNILLWNPFSPIKETLSLIIIWTCQFPGSSFLKYFSSNKSYHHYNGLWKCRIHSQITNYLVPSPL